MRLPRRLGVLFTIAAWAACSDSTAPGPQSITVLTQNLYLGAALDPILNATPVTLPFAVSQAFAQVQATDFPERAERIADEIAATHPDLVALQEVALYRRQSPGDAITGGTTPATTVVLDFQALLLAALAARGLTYVPVATRTGLDFEVPMATGSLPAGPTYDDLRFTDRDVILAKSGSATANPQGADFTARAPVTVGGTAIAIPRGWTSIEAGGVRLVDTHLEIQAARPIQEAQGRELIDLLAHESRPLILMGDFNSAANVFQTQSYSLLTAAGYTDAWSQLHRSDSGFTCCQASDLLNAASILNARLDFIFWRNGVSVTRVDVEGADSVSRTASGLWPSDHAGVVATLTVK